MATQSGKKHVRLFDSSANEYTSTNPLPSYAPAETTEITIGEGSKDVETAGTAKALVDSSTKIIGLEITAKSTNTGKIYVGSSSVSSSNSGIVLEAGDVFSLRLPAGQYTDLSKWYIDAEKDGEGVTFTYLEA